MKKIVKSTVIQFLRFNVLLLLVVFSPRLYSQQNLDKTIDVETTQNKIKEKPPTLSEIIPEEAILSDKLSLLNNSIEDLVDDKSIQANYKVIANNLKAITTEFEKYKKEGNVSTNELDNLKSELNQSGQQFDDSNNSVKSAIEIIEKSRDEWLQYKKKWKGYEDLLSEQDLPNEAKKSLKGASATIEKALDVLSSKLNTLMRLQQSGYANQSVINDLDTQILKLKQKKIASAFEDGSIPMYSPKFYDQFNYKLWSDIKRGFQNVILPNKIFFENNWWVFVFQFFVTLITIYIIRKNKNFLKNSTDYSYFSERSVSAGIFFGFLSILIFHTNMKSAPIWYLFSFLIGGFAFCRLISNRDVDSWKNNFFYTLVAILGFSGVFHVFNFPIVLFRIFVLFVSLFGIYRLIILHKKNKETSNSKGYMWFFFGLFIYLWIIVISEIIGKEVLALYMYESLLKTVVLIVFAVVFLNLIRGGIELGLKSISQTDEVVKDSDEEDEEQELLDKTVGRFSGLVGVLIFLLGVFPRVLVFWNIYNDVPEAYNELINIGFSIGENKLSLGALITSICILYGSYIFSIVIEMLLMNDRIEGKLDRGARMSIGQLIRYFLMFFGFLIAIAALGFNLTNFTIVLSALGVGIGFGLQGVVNNFVSGLILLFERPIREGDTIEVEGTWSGVKKIGLRSTTVQTFDQSDIIIPNADLVYNKVTNWTLNNQRKRVTVSVGVAYGSDINLVFKLLEEIGSEGDGIVKSVKPMVLFREFGDSTLNFELRVRAKDALNAINVESDIRRQIDKKFRENNIEIAFPQRDLHIRTIDESALINYSRSNNFTDNELMAAQNQQDKNKERDQKHEEESEDTNVSNTTSSAKTVAKKETLDKASKPKVTKPVVKKTTTSKSSKPKVEKPIAKKPKEDKPTDKK